MTTKTESILWRLGAWAPTPGFQVVIRSSARNCIAMIMASAREDGWFPCRMEYWPRDDGDPPRLLRSIERDGWTDWEWRT